MVMAMMWSNMARCIGIPSFQLSLIAVLAIASNCCYDAFSPVATRVNGAAPLPLAPSATADNEATGADDDSSMVISPRKKVVIIGAGWGGLSAAHTLSSQTDVALDIAVVDTAPRPGGLVRDGFSTASGKRRAEAGQHGFWDNYHNIFRLLEELPNVDVDEVLTGYAEQGQYSPAGLEAVWPVYRQNPTLPTGLAQALYTRFENLPALDRATAAPLVLAFSEFDDSPEAWEKYDNISFRDLCVKLGVSRRCYEEAFEPMILTGLFAPGAECSAAAALGMAYFFVLKSQNSFDVRWCRGNIGEMIFQPWVEHMRNPGKGKQTVDFLTSTRVVDFELIEGTRNIGTVACCNEKGEESKLECDMLVFAVGGAALSSMVRGSAVLSSEEEFRRYANLRGTGVLATRLYLDRRIETPHSANACWGFDEGVGMTVFDITKLHDLDGEGGSVIETDYYHAASLLAMDDDAVVSKVKDDLDAIFPDCGEASVLDAAVVRLPQAVNWYSPGSYRNMPNAVSTVFGNVYYAGDIVRTRHGSWSQEKAYVTGMEAANTVLGRDISDGVIPLSPDEPHVAAGRAAVSALKKLAGFGDASRAPSLVDFLW